MSAWAGIAHRHGVLALPKLWGQQTCSLGCQWHPGPHAGRSGMLHERPCCPGLLLAELRALSPSTWLWQCQMVVRAAG